MTRAKESELPMRHRVARAALIIYFVTFFVSSLVLCSCPGFFVVMALCAILAAVLGSRLQRIFSAILIVIAIGGFIVQMKDEKRMLEKVRRIRAHFMANSASASAPNSATKELPFVNSLGMKFVPVEITGGPTDGKRILFSIWDTRVQDYAEYAKAKGFTLKSDYPIDRSFKQGPTHPVVMVNSEDAKSFCLWLTSIERASGKIGKQDEYRLPSDREWGCAAGIGEHDSPIWSLDSRGEDFEVGRWRHRRFGDVRRLYSKSEKIEGYPWGTQWPPPKNAGNYSPFLHLDAFEHTSPVGSFAANENGLYDMSGNVWQWCDDFGEKEHFNGVLRGGAWSSFDELELQSSYRFTRGWSVATTTAGFRCILELTASQ